MRVCSDENGGGCVWEPVKTVNVPSSAYFADYSDMVRAHMDRCVGYCFLFLPCCPPALPQPEVYPVNQLKVQKSACNALQQ